MPWRLSAWAEKTASMKLSSVTQGKNNNFNLIRIIAALAVLFGHSYALLGQPEPLGKLLGMSVGSIAVDIFFITSGFLVAGSLLVRQNIGDYIWARVLRIFPALWVMLLLTVFGLGALLTSLPLAAYLSHPDTYAYLMKCASLVTGVVYSLPGVFEQNPFKSVMNGSLWTMPYEVTMYFILGIFWLVYRLGKRANLPQSGWALVAAVLILLLFLFEQLHLLDTGEFVRTFFMFFTGAAYFLLKQRVTLSHRFFGLCLFALVLAGLAGKQAFSIVYYLTIAYLLFYLAYLPAGAIRKYNALGDYSYGVYIYAFPLQQALVALFPQLTVAALMAASAALSMLLAILSWHGIEKRALRLKEFFHARPASHPAAATLPPHT